MYTISIDGKTMYAPNIANEGYSVLNPKLTMELNKSGSLEFTLPPNNVMYDQIQKLKSIVQVYDGNEEIFRGRVLHDEKGFYKRKQVYCEGELAFLLDSVQRVYSYSGSLEGLFRKYISNHNEQVEETKQFRVGQITVTDKNNYVHYSSIQYPNTWDELNEKLIKTHGGYVRTRLASNGIRYIDYIEDYETVSPQIIEFGINLLDISEYIKADDVFTILIPLGATQAETGERLTISSVNSGKDYIVDQSAVNLFGYIWKTNVWENVTQANNLLSKGRQFLAKGVQMSVSLTMKAVDLHLVNVNTNRIKVGDHVRVVSLPHDLDRLFQCTKIILDMVDPKKSEYEFGVTFTSMTDMQVNDQKGNQSNSAVIQDIAYQARNTANEASAKVDAMVTTLESDYVKDSTFQTFKQQVNSNYALKSEIPTKVSDLTNDSGFIDQTTYNALEARVTALEQRGE